MSLSKLAHQFVRTKHTVTDDGREFNLPYKKRVNVTTKALTENFV